MDIIGLGDTDVDLMIRVDHLPKHDEKVRGHLEGKFPGGIIGNFCCAVQQFGAQAGAVCKVGKDDFGKICMDDFIQRGVDTSHMVVDGQSETYFCIVHLDHSGEKALTIVETTSLVPHFADIDLNYLKTARYVHMSSLDVELAEQVGRALKGSGTQLSLDIEPTASKATLSAWKRVLENTSIALPNQAGLAVLTGLDDVEQGARALLDWGAKLVVVTCGGQGVKLFARDYAFAHSIFAVPVKDTTGAGDCFNGVFLSCLTKGFSKEKAAKYACAAAAISIGQVGARSALPTLEQVESFIREREGEGYAN